MEALIKQMLDGRILLAEAVGEFEKIYIRQALERNDDHLMRTAEALGIHRNTLSSRLATYNGSKQPKNSTSKRRSRSSTSSSRRSSKSSKAKTRTKRRKA
jgi:hypothetical protein